MFYCLLVLCQSNRSYCEQFLFKNSDKYLFSITIVNFLRSLNFNTAQSILDNEHYGLMTDRASVTEKFKMHQKQTAYIFIFLKLGRLLIGRMLFLVLTLFFHFFLFLCCAFSFCTFVYVFVFVSSGPL